MAKLQYLVPIAITPFAITLEDIAI